jgi:hypothetical protein
VVFPSKGALGPTAPLTEAVGAAHRLPCDARTHGPSQNSLRSLRSLRSNSCDELDVRMRAARAAMSPALLSASDALRSRPERPFAAPPSHYPRRVPRSCRSGRWCPAGSESVAASSAVSGVGARSAHPKILTRRTCSSAMSAANEASCAARPRTEQRSGVDAQHRPPQLSGLAGAACRDLVVIERSAVQPTSPETVHSP